MEASCMIALQIPHTRRSWNSSVSGFLEYKSPTGDCFDKFRSEYISYKIDIKPLKKALLLYYNELCEFSYIHKLENYRTLRWLTSL